MTKRAWFAIALAALLALLPAQALSEGLEEDEAQYYENSYNYVDVSMDVSGGIPENAMGVLGAIREAGVLRVATEPYFPPQEFIDPALSGQDSFVGADMELARLIARRMGVALEIVPVEFSRVLDVVTEGSCDLAISALSYTPGRGAAMTLTKGYYFAGGDAGSALIIRAADLSAISALDDLRDRNIAAQSGSIQEAQLSEKVFNYREFRRMTQVADIYQALMDGTVDAAAVDVQAGTAYIMNNPDCGLALVPRIRFTLEEQFQGDRVAVKKGELQLAGFVNGVIDEVVASGQYQAWYDAAAVRARELDM